MTDKPKKTSKKKQKKQARAGRVRQLHASLEEDLESVMEPGAKTESRWNRPRRHRICLRIDFGVA